jgi:hypothetical protein
LIEADYDGNSVLLQAEVKDTGEKIFDIASLKYDAVGDNVENYANWVLDNPASIEEACDPENGYNPNKIEFYDENGDLLLTAPSN